MRRSLLALLLASTMTAASGCSAVDTLTERFREDEVVGTPTATIAVLTTLTGGLSQSGEAIVAAVEQAVDDSVGVSGWEIDVEALDLAGDDLESTLDQIREDDSTVAVVTGFGAADVRVVVPVLDDAGLTLLSPADTDPRHVKGADPAAPLRPWGGYVTVAVERTPEQAALADHLVRVAHVSQVLIAADGSLGAAVRSEALTRGFEQRGMLDVSTVTQPEPGKKNMKKEFDRAVAALPPGGVLVVDGPPAFARSLAAQRPAGTALAVAVLPDELDDPTAEALEGAVAPQPGLDPDRGSTELSTALEQGGRSSRVHRVGPAAYDGTRLLVDAFTRCLPDPSHTSSPSRSACRNEVAGASWIGLTGPIRFDEYGARLGLLPSVVTLRSGSWYEPGT